MSPALPLGAGRPGDEAATAWRASVRSPLAPSTLRLCGSRVQFFGQGARACVLCVRNSRCGPATWLSLADSTIVRQPPPACVPVAEDQLASALEDRRLLLDYVVRLATGAVAPSASPGPVRVAFPPNSLESSGGDLVGGHRSTPSKACLPCTGQPRMSSETAPQRRLDAARVDVPKLLQSIGADEQIDLSYASVPRIAQLTQALPALGNEEGAEFAAAFTEEQFCLMAYEALLAVTAASTAGPLPDHESEVRAIPIWQHR